VTSYPAGINLSNHALITVADALRHRRTMVGTRWRRLTAGQQALLVLAHLRKGETYTDLATGFGIGTTTVFRYVREALDVLAALAPPLHQAMTAAAGKAFVILDGTLLAIDRVGMASGRDRPYYSGKHKRHGVNVQVIADPAGRLVRGIRGATRRPPRHGRRPPRRPSRPRTTRHRPERRPAGTSRSGFPSPRTSRGVSSWSTDGLGGAASTAASPASTRSTWTSTVNAGAASMRCWTRRRTLSRRLGPNRCPA
jgi:hypothetical protein